jgi:hypothetical protein
LFQHGFILAESVNLIVFSVSFPVPKILPRFINECYYRRWDGKGQTLPQLAVFAAHECSAGSNDSDWNLLARTRIFGKMQLTAECSAESMKLLESHSNPSHPVFRFIVCKTFQSMLRLFKRILTRKSSILLHDLTEIEDINLMTCLTQDFPVTLRHVDKGLDFHDHYDVFIFAAVPLDEHIKIPLIKRKEIVFLCDVNKMVRRKLPLKELFESSISLLLEIVPTEDQEFGVQQE